MNQLRFFGFVFIFSGVINVYAQADRIHSSSAPYLSVTHSSKGCSIVSKDPNVALFRSNQPIPKDFAKSVIKLTCIGSCDEGIECNFVTRTESQVDCIGCDKCSVYAEAIEIRTSQPSIKNFVKPK